MVRSVMSKEELLAVDEDFCMPERWERWRILPQEAEAYSDHECE